MEVDHFDVTVVSKLKQTDLLKAMRDKGMSGKNAAEFLGVSYGTFVRWLRLDFVPEVPLKLEPEEKRLRFHRKLMELTGKTWEEIFPVPIRKGQVPQEFEHRHKVPAQHLLMPAVPFLPANQETAVAIREVRDAIRDVVRKKMTSRQGKIIEQRFFEEMTLDEIAASNGISRERVRQIINAGLTHLQRSLKSDARLADAELILRQDRDY